MLKIAICDDEVKSITKYSKLLKELADKHHIDIDISTYTSGEALLFEWSDATRQADALYLDIHMEGIDGMKVARELRTAGCVKDIIFISADKEPVFEAFDVEAFHYLVKHQLDKSRFEEVFIKLVRRLVKRRREFITLSFGGEIRDVPIDEIKYFIVEARSVTVYYGLDEKFEFYSTIGKLEALFCSRGFIRIHRSVLVNGAYIKRATRKTVIMQDDKSLPVGRSHVDELKEIIERWGL